MNRLRQAGDSHYDVLGLPPGASAVEIDTSYRRLIDGEGYKVGVPLNRQWLRARQIKDAYDTLGNPEKRRAYDESLSQPTAAAPWAMTAADPATDSLILPPAGSETAEPVEQESAADAGARGHAPTATSEPAGQDFGAAVDADDPGAIEAADDDERPAGGKWLIGEAAAAVIGVATVALWPSDPLPSTDQRAPSLAAGAGGVTGAGHGLVDQATNSEVGSAASRAEQPNQATAATDAARRDAGDATGAPDASHDAGEAAAADATNVQRAGDAPLAEADSASALASSSGTVEADAAAPAASSTQAATAPPIMAERANGEIRSPAQWIGGGPTDADNRRGRYEGTVAVQVTVEADGSVSRCATVSGSGNAGLDDMTCRLVRERARFEPALDPQGRPVASQAYTSFTWGRRRPR